ncbi:YncE family protein [Kitasatospora phosalacinea]|uniref:Lipoprotein n=1 Tax=Kitasatospora phosalacinea TaxID=2065 RepID=A0A9W6UN11_9ACTN|nr:lipoprotein [Kitasatospora phosalacinea]GLW53085.1 lipoprotein [Kitasatospora phosalacinea]
MTTRRRRTGPQLLAAGPAPAVLLALLLALLLSGCADPGGSAAEPRPTAAAPVTPAPAAPARSDPASAPAAPTPAGTLLVTDFGADTVTFVDPARGAIGSVRVGTAPYAVAVGADGRAWVSTAEGVAEVDTRARALVRTVPLRTDTGPAGTGEYRGGAMGLALSSDGTRLYVGVNVPGRSGVLEVVDTAKGEVTGAAAVGRRPFDVDVSPDGRQVYATGHDSFDVTVVAADGLATRRIQVAPYGTEGGLGSWLKPHYAAVRPGDGKLLLPFEGERLAVVDPVTGQVAIEPMTADTHQHGATLAPDGRLLVVGSGPVTGDDRGPSLTVRDPDGSERVHPLGVPHENVAISADGRTAYVTGGFTRDGYWDGITLVDLDSGTTHRLEAGHRPLGVAVL